MKISEGITDSQVAQVLDGLKPEVTDRAQAAEQVKKLYNMFNTCDCTLLEVRGTHPLQQQCLF